jgi:hypothetical protein
VALAILSPALAATPSDAVRLGSPEVSYIDPEILSSAHKLSFQDRAGTIWVADLDPATGTFRSEDGRDVKVDGGAVNLLVTFQGPEFGVDETGWAVYYTKEYDGELLVLALVDYTSLAIYKDNGGEYWDRIATITVPEEIEMKYIRSPETFVAGGRSYISVGLRAGQAAPWGQRRRAAAGRTDAEVWIFGLDPDPSTRFARRCDDGRPGVRRSDPETYIGADEIYVFYTVYSPEGIEIWRAGTGIKP